MERLIAGVFVVACLVAGAVCLAIASTWGPPRSNGLGTQALRGGSGADHLRGAEGPDVARQWRRRPADRDFRDGDRRPAVQGRRGRRLGG